MNILIHHRISHSSRLSHVASVFFTSRLPRLCHGCDVGEGQVEEGRGRASVFGTHEMCLEPQRNNGQKSKTSQKRNCEQIKNLAKENGGSDTHFQHGISGDCRVSPVSHTHVQYIATCTQRSLQKNKTDLIY